MMSYSPRSMAAAADTTACSPDAQARVTVYPSQPASNCRSSAISRAMLGAPLGRMTPPHTIAWTSPLGSPVRSSSPRTAVSARSMESIRV